MQTPRSCLILGSGMGGLALGALLARAGIEVTILEAHPEWIGGWAHTLRVGEYRFAAGPRYLWNFGPGQIGGKFLQKCDLAASVPLVELDRQGFDHIYIGDEAPIHVPNGWTDYEALLKDRFPAEVAGIRRFFALCRKAFAVLEIIDERGLLLEPRSSAIAKCLWRRPLATAWFVLRRHFTLQQAMDLCGLGDGVRRVLGAHAGVFAQPAASLSFHAYAAGTLLYHRGCYYPVNDMEGFAAALVKTIEDRHGRVLRGQRVVAATASRGGIEQVRTQTGESFSADAVVVNFDPKTFLDLLAPPATTARPMPRYAYSRSIYSLFLGLTSFQPLQGHFGRWNLWYVPRTAPVSSLWDAGPLDDSTCLYLNSPTLVKGVTNDAPPGHATVTAFAPAGQAGWTPGQTDVNGAMKEKLTERLLDLIGSRFIPGLRDSLAAVHLCTPEDKERDMLAPQGNIYGRSFDAREVWTWLPYKGILPNLYFVGAYMSFAGIASVIQAGCRVYEELTGDGV